MNGFINYLRSIYLIKVKFPDRDVNIKVPQKSKKEGSSIIQRLLPIGVFLAVFIGFTLISNALRGNSNSSGYFSGGFIFISMFASAISGLIVSRIQKKNIQNEEKEIFTDWEEDIKSLDQNLANDYSQRQKYLENCYYSSESKIINAVEERTSYLWNVAKTHPDYLNESIGTSVVYSGINILVDGKTKYLDDEQKGLLSHLTDAYGSFRNVPYSIDLPSCGNIGVYGVNRYSFIRSFITKLCVRHGYDLVKVVLICDKSNYSELEWMKWLPHMWDDLKSIRFIINDISRSKDNESLIDYISKEVDKANDGCDMSYYMFVISGDNNIYGKQFFRFVQDLEKAERASILVAGSKKSDVPTYCSTLIDASGSVPKLYNVDNIDGKPFYIDEISYASAERISRDLSRITLIDSPDSSRIPHIIGFMDMLFSEGVFDRNLSLQDNILSCWSKATLPAEDEALFGAVENGEPYKIKLNQFSFKHMILAGRARSGKSQFLMSFVTYLMVNYPPSHVKFLFLDFKGSALSKCFRETPHCAGAFSDLDKGDKSSINRLKEMITSEIKRREQIFDRMNIQPQDVEAYNTMVRRRGQGELMPHIFIVVDEYVELLTHHPDFTQVFEQVSHKGASAGIHLILASQRLDTNVGAQILANVDVSICFKVNSSEESKSMVGHSDAKDIKIRGRGFIRTDDVNLEFQAPYIEKYYMPYAVESRQDIFLVLPNGKTISRPKQESGNLDSEEEKLTELQKMTMVLTGIKKTMEKGYPQVLAPIFTPDLPKYFCWDKEEPQQYLAKELKNAEGRMICSAFIGMADDFTKHRHMRGTIPLTGKHYLIAGEAKRGKTTLLKSIIYSSCMMCSPKHLNFYICDFMGKEFQPMLSLPHVHSNVIDNFEQLFRLFSFLGTVVNMRREKFCDQYSDIIEYRHKNPEEDMPDIVVVIDDADNINDYLVELVRNDVLYDKVSAMIANSYERYGVTFIISVKETNRRMLSSFNNKIALYYSDDTASTLVDAPRELMLERIAGRCFVYYEDRLLVTQIIGFPSDAEKTVSQKTREIISESLNKMPEAWKSYEVYRVIQRIPREPISVLQGKPHSYTAIIPVFTDNETNSTVFLDSEYLNSFYVLGRKELCTRYIKIIVQQAIKVGMEIHVVDFSNSLQLDNNDNIHYYTLDNLRELLGSNGSMRSNEDYDKNRLLITTDLTDTVDLSRKGSNGLGDQSMLTSILSEIYDGGDMRRNRFWIATDRFQNIQPSQNRFANASMNHIKAFSTSVRAIEIASFREVNPRYMPLLDIEYLNSELPDDQAWFCNRGAFRRVVLPSQF